jgi:hypothetical protein
MRTTALITVLSGVAMASHKHHSKSGTGRKDAIYGGVVIHAPPVTTTVTETTTQYDTITAYETPRIVHQKAFVTAPPVTTTVTEYVGELYDQSYGNGYELGDMIVAPTVVTETKTFTLVVSGAKETITTTELVKEWTIDAVPGKTTITQYTSTAWVDERATSTIWIDAEPTEEPTEEPVQKRPANPTKTVELEDGYGGLEDAEPTSSTVHVIDVPEDDELSADEFEDLLSEILQEEQEAAEDAAASETPLASASSPSHAYTAARPHGPTPSYHGAPHKPSPSTFATKASAQASRPKPSVSAGDWQGKLLNTTDGTCGPKGGQVAWSCYGNQKGSCCSAYGHCGSEAAHCGAGCQAAFGDCGAASA